MLESPRAGVWTLKEAVGTDLSGRTGSVVIAEGELLGGLHEEVEVGEIGPLLDLLGRAYDVMRERRVSSPLMADIESLLREHGRLQ